MPEALDVIEIIDPPVPVAAKVPKIVCVAPSANV